MYSCCNFHVVTTFPSNASITQCVIVVGLSFDNRDMIFYARMKIFSSVPCKGMGDSFAEIKISNV